MNEKILNDILRQIVVDMSYQPGLQVNAYAFSDRDPDLTNQSFGMTYEQFDAGYFWARSWVGSGASRSTICGQYPVLFAEPSSVRFDVAGDPDGEVRYNLLLIDEVGCDGCPDHGERSGRQVAANVRSMLLSIIDELIAYGRYIVTPDDGPPFEAWISENRIDAGLIDADTQIIGDLMSYVIPEPIDLQEWGNHPQRRGYYVTLRFRWCEPRRAVFSYRNDSPDTVGVVKCPC